jgi:hypothetical protein
MLVSGAVIVALPPIAGLWIIGGLFPAYLFTHVWGDLKKRGRALYLSACVVAALFCFYKADREIVGANMRLNYRICAAPVPDDQMRTSAFLLEIEPRNPNSETIHFVLTRHFLKFGGRASEQRFDTDKEMDVVPIDKLPGTVIPIVKDAVVFNPPAYPPEGPMTGEYHYVFKFGRDQDHLSRQMEVNGNVAVEYDAYGNPTSHAKFTPIGDKDINFDPVPCDLREAKANE